MTASASLKGFIYYVTIDEYAYAFLSFPVMRIMEIKLDVLVRATKAKHAVCIHPRELGRMVFTLETQPRLCSQALWCL